MIDPDKLKFYFSIFRGLGPTDLVPVFKMVSIKKLEPGEVYLREGKKHMKAAYIKKGLIRAWLLKPNGEEATTLVRWEDQIVADHDGIIMDRPLKVTYEALEKTTLLELDYQQLQILMDNNPKLEQGRIYFLKDVIGELMERMENFVALSPEERYLNFITQKPGIANRVQDKYIASLLGMTPVSLSRIRKRIAEKERGK